VFSLEFTLAKDRSADTASYAQNVYKLARVLHSEMAEIIHGKMFKNYDAGVQFVENSLQETACTQLKHCSSL